MIKCSIYSCLFAITLMCSCGIEKSSDSNEMGVTQIDLPYVDVKKEPHKYGGWYCPDNLKGFPPVDIKDIDKIEVITDRLPTKKETQDGRSLMYIDPILHPEARPFDLDLPRLARTHSRTDDSQELIIIIQAAIIGTDTIVGYRYPTGGNGSGWLDEVTLLTDAEMKTLGETPYTFVEIEIDASKTDVWDAITMTDYANDLSKYFNKKAVFSSAWQDGTIPLQHEASGETAQGSIRGMWGAIYMDIRYRKTEFETIEKMVLVPAPENRSRLQFVAGPYPADHALQQERWTAWANEVKQLSER